MAKKVVAEATPKPDAEVGVRVFVYGTLKRLHYNHVTINQEGTNFLGACYIEGPYQMRDLVWFPGVQYIPDATKKNRIYGEVYRISEETLQALDILEGNGNFFKRTQVDTPWKKAWMYMIPVSYDKREIVTGGVWKPNVQEKTFIHSGSNMLSSEDYFKMIPTL